MKKLLVALSVLVIASLTGCRGQAQADYGDTLVTVFRVPNNLLKNMESMVRK